MSKKYKRDDFGNRMKAYELQANDKTLIPNLPVIVRLDGKNFSKYTSMLNKPYDERFIKLMENTCKYLIQQFPKIKVIYSQSDEINIVMSNQYLDPIEYNGRIQKLCSILASTCSVYFACNTEDIEEDVLNYYPVFDCRVFNVPDWTEASNILLWRENDATKNSILSAGYYYFSQKEMHGLNTNQIQEKLLLEANINWNNYPNYFKRGFYIKREKYFDQKLNTERTYFAVKDFGQPLSKFTLEERLNLLFDI